MFLLYKVKPEIIEQIHWAAGGIPINAIKATIHNSLENYERPTIENITEMLLEEYTKQQIEVVQERVKKEAKRKNVSVSKLIRDIVEKSLPSEGDLIYDTIILKIPSDVKSSPEKLQEWLNPRVDSIIKNLTNSVI
jgi:hypothetical protein